MANYEVLRQNTLEELRRPLAEPRMVTPKEKDTRSLTTGTVEDIHVDVPSAVETYGRGSSRLERQPICYEDERSGENTQGSSDLETADFETPSGDKLCWLEIQTFQGTCKVHRWNCEMPGLSNMSNVTSVEDEPVPKEDQKGQTQL